MTPFRFTTSWDDGHPLDLRIADMLSRHGLPGTFYVPLANREGGPVLGRDDIRSLDAAFEIGSHTRDHVYLKTIPAAAAAEQIADGRRLLEDSLGHAVSGFAYPGGKHDAAIRDAVARAGFAYARTTENFRIDLPPDSFRMPTTLQIYPHRRDIYVRNLVARGHLAARGPVFLRAICQADLFARLRDLFAHARQAGGIFHVWGHSREIGELDLWKPLDLFFAHVAERLSAGEGVPNGGLMPRREGDAR